MFINTANQIVRHAACHAGGLRGYRLNSFSCRRPAWIAGSSLVKPGNDDVVLLSHSCRNSNTEPFQSAGKIGRCQIDLQDSAMSRYARSVRCVQDQSRIEPDTGVFNALDHMCTEFSKWPHAALAPFSAIATSARKMPVAPLRRAGGVSHSSKNTTFMSGRTRAPSGCLAI